VARKRIKSKCWHSVIYKVCNFKRLGWISIFPYSMHQPSLYELQCVVLETFKNELKSSVHYSNHLFFALNNQTRKCSHCYACSCNVDILYFKAKFWIFMFLLFFFWFIVWLYIVCCTSKGSGTSMAHRGIRGKCHQHHLWGMKLQKIRILTSVHPCPTSGSDPNH